MKTCNLCKKVKPVTDFHKKKNSSQGVKNRCKVCVKVTDAKCYYEKNKENRLKRQASPEYQLYIRSFRLKTKYGLTLEDYDKMLKSQNGVCKTCKSSDPGGSAGKYFHVDHCHLTNKVRGILCSRCNSALGYVKDSIETLENLIIYLKEAKEL